MDTATSQYFTLLYGILDVEAKEFRFVSAGHPGPVHGPKGRPVEQVRALEKTRHLPLKENLSATVESATRWQDSSGAQDDLSLLGFEIG